MNSVIRMLALLCLLSTGCGSANDAAHRPAAATEPPAVSAMRFDAHLLVDQFGYRPGDAKIAVIRNPRVGYDSASTFTPGTQYEVRRADDARVVFTGTPGVWHGGAVEASSGDSGWWFDFSPVTTPGRYVVFDVQRGVRSAAFNIDPLVYKNVLKAAVRMYFYQRSGIAKQAAQAGSCWVDEPAYLGPDQDTQAHDITDPDNKAKFKNVAGGWFDAGDTNKYVTYAPQPVHQLLTAYQENPGVFTDDFNIPESGNGVPDVLDEVKWETDWLKRMQSPDGSAALKVGETVYRPAAPPSSDHTPRFYIPSCTSSTIAVAGMFAHASYVFGKIPSLAGEATELRARAVSAWNNYQATSPKQTRCDTDVIHAGNADWDLARQQAEAVTAAVYLYAITDDKDYEGYLKAHLHDAKPYHDAGWTRYDPHQGEALLFYTTLTHADPDLGQTIRADKSNDSRAAAQIYGVNAEDDLYRSFLSDSQYHWGSNGPRAGYGNSNTDMITYDIPGGDPADYRTRALDTLHYFHGVNPFGIVYLTNMKSYGATRSINTLWHAWFARGSQWADAESSRCGPAPGYMPGGPNARAANDVPGSLTPPVGQPPQKSYKDWNVGTPENSWAINEPAIYYQSGYVKLLSKFAQ